MTWLIYHVANGSSFKELLDGTEIQECDDLISQYNQLVDEPLEKGIEYKHNAKIKLTNRGQNLYWGGH